MGKEVRLIKVDGDANNNKFYNMKENGDGTFTATYGRVGAAKPQTDTKPMSKWDAVYREKTSIKKGYVDQTDLFIEESVVVDTDATTSTKKKTIYKDFLASRSAAVVQMVRDLQGWAKGSVERNYTVSSEAVTQKQVDKAQETLDQIVGFQLDANNIAEFNKLLQAFYSIVPRKMKHVKAHLVDPDSDITERKNEIITEEQATLDVMAGQVKLNSDMKDGEVDEDEEEIETDILKSSGLDMNEVTDDAVIKQIKSMMADNSHKFLKAFEVVNMNTQGKYDSHLTSVANKKEELFWHGSRNENWFSIISSGLLIRPSNAVYTGSMFGDGIYFADKFQKSFGYTSGRGSYWVGGNAPVALLALYSVHVGQQKIIKRHDSSCYKLCHSVLAKENCDSVFAQGGIDLRNNEYIVYQSQQNTIKYLVMVKA
jgi:poly [ADP-ribose] polymerase 2/3/4